MSMTTTIERRFSWRRRCAYWLLRTEITDDGRVFYSTSGTPRFGTLGRWMAYRLLGVDTRLR
jgi:hypothetical protein